MKKIYLDYAATTPVDPEVLRAMQPYFGKKFGNPGSLHSFGQEAIKAVDESREKIAKAIGADFREVIFTGSATEANNLALRGAVKFFGNPRAGARIIASAIEHESVLETAKDLERDGVEVVYIPVDKEGFVDLKKIENALNERTVLVSVMYANNEVGTVQPIAEIAKIVKAKSRSLFHTDAVQAFQYLNCNVNDLGADLMTLSAHKIYGPKGIGILYVRNPKPGAYNLKPIIAGGGQEFGLRSGTENAPYIAGFAEAVRIAEENRQKEKERVAELRDYFWAEFKKICPKAELNGPAADLSYDKRLPNNLNVYIPDVESQFFLTELDLAGVAASSGSACSARSLTPSYVIEALGCAKERAKRSVRFSFGKHINRDDIDEAIKRIKNIIIKTI